ncbi:MAG: hypothetical protein WBS20_17755 [Lysobacterales bacterium]
MKDMVGDRNLPRPWGVGIDFFTMNQKYEIKDLSFALPGVSLGDPSQIKVTNEVQHFDFKGDAWVLPFLNVFGVLGRVKIDTIVDFSQVEITGLPISLGKLPVKFNGTVYGGGFTLAYGAENWFTSVTTTFTKTNTSGDLDSKVKSTSVQPRVGLLKDSWQFWVGGMYLKTDETHSGDFDLPFIGPVPFSVELQTADKWNYVVGTGYAFTDRATLRLEYGFGNRTHTLFTFNVRF